MTEPVITDNRSANRFEAHLDGRLAGYAETLRLAELDDTRAVFAAAADAGQADRVIYERTTPDTLVFTLHFREDANRAPLTLEFTREHSTPAQRPTDD